MYEFLCIFFVYAFFGWCTEVCYAALVTGKFVNRGFLNGPVCPIYGIGVALILLCLEPLREHLFALFLAAVVLTSLLELICGFVLEKLFHQRWWDYSEEPFNLGGYICLRFSIAWGLACLFVVELLHPTIAWVIGLLPQGVGWALLGVFTAGMAVDLAATVSTITRLNHKLEHIDQLAGRIREASDELGENLADRVLDAAEKGADFRESMQELREGMEDWSGDLRGELLEDLGEARQAIAQRRMERTDRRRERRAELEQLFDELRRELDGKVPGEGRLMKAFPRMRSLNHKQALERLRRRNRR